MMVIVVSVYNRDITVFAMCTIFSFKVLVWSWGAHYARVK